MMVKFMQQATSNERRGGFAVFAARILLAAYCFLLASVQVYKILLLADKQFQDKANSTTKDPQHEYHVLISYLACAITLGISLTGIHAVCTKSLLSYRTIVLFFALSTILHLGSACYAFTDHHKVLAHMDESLRRAQPLYDWNSSPVSQAFDDLHKDFQCCGRHSRSEWIAHNRRPLNYSILTMPTSCCSNEALANSVDHHCSIFAAFDKGCIEEMQSVLDTSLLIDIIRFFNCLAMTAMTILLAKSDLKTVARLIHDKPASHEVKPLANIVVSMPPPSGGHNLSF